MQLTGLGINHTLHAHTQIQKVMPVLERYRVDMPLDCPFHPKRDLLWWPDTKRDQSTDNDVYDDDDGVWMCPVCGSSYFCAERLAVHWDEEHRPSNKVNLIFNCNSDLFSFFSFSFVFSLYITSLLYCFLHTVFSPWQALSLPLTCTQANVHFALCNAFCLKRELFFLFALCSL